MSHARSNARLLLVACMLAFGAAPAHADIVPLSALTPAAADSLKPGQYLWGADEAAGPATIIVNLKRQRGYVYRSGALVGVTTVSTGKPGHSTPVGEFTILEKRADHRSNLYANAPMPFMQRLTWGGVAIHGGHVPGHRASHGCIRVPIGFARLLFAATRVGATVQVIEDDGGRPVVETVTLPPSSWREQYADDYVSWGRSWDKAAGIR